jgi:hypothetical protein
VFGFNDELQLTPGTYIGIGLHPPR